MVVNWVAQRYKEEREEERNIAKYKATFADDDWVPNKPLEIAFTKNMYHPKVMARSILLGGFTATGTSISSGIGVGYSLALGFLGSCLGIPAAVTISYVKNLAKEPFYQSAIINHLVKKSQRSQVDGLEDSRLEQLVGAEVQ